MTDLTGISQIDLPAEALLCKMLVRHATDIAEVLALALDEQEMTLLGPPPRGGRIIVEGEGNPRHVLVDRGQLDALVKIARETAAQLAPSPYTLEQIEQGLAVEWLAALAADLARAADRLAPPCRVDPETGRAVPVPPGTPEEQAP